MEPITSDTILILAGSFLCVFLSLITVGGLFLFWRTKQQIHRDAPPPQPPPVTRDVHAEPLAEMPTRNDGDDDSAQSIEPPTVQRSPARPATEPPTIQRTPTRPSYPPPTEVTMDDETVTRSRTAPRPLGLDLDDAFDDGGETTTRNLPLGGSLETIILPTATETDTTPTVIIDRTQPMIDEDE